MIKNIFKKLTGLDKIEAEVADATRRKIEAEVAAEKAVEDARLAKISPKERATEAKEPWVEVLDTHVNKDNVRNGFFELDWNEYFVLQLRSNGYQGDSDEVIVDQWFQDLCRNIGAEQGINMERRASGFVNVNDLGNGKSEIS
jgi:hypothetical protein